MRQVPFVCVLLAGLVVAPAVGQIPDRPVNDAERRTVLHEIATRLEGGYIFADKGEAFAARIGEDLAAGRFDDLDRLEPFVMELNTYLYELSNDKHLRVWGAPPPDHEDAGDDADEAQHPARRERRDSGRSTYGFVAWERMAGNVGYIDLRGFSGDEASKPMADEVMMSLEGVDALILDLRQNKGGAPFMVRYLSGFLFAEPTHLASTMMRDWDEPRERWTLQEGLPTRAFVDTPVYVLTSGGTFSAAESFTFGLKINDRITQVGERTGGGGHWGQTAPIGADLQMFLPTGRTYDPATGLGWEAEGLEPDIEVAADEALDAALKAIRGE